MCLCEIFCQYISTDNPGNSYIDTATMYLKQIVRTAQSSQFCHWLQYYTVNITSYFLSHQHPYINFDFIGLPENAYYYAKQYFRDECNNEGLQLFIKLILIHCKIDWLI